MFLYTLFFIKNIYKSTIPNTIMFFKKKGMIDVRDLQSRGVMKIPRGNVSVPTDKDGFIRISNDSDAHSISSGITASSLISAPSTPRRTLRIGAGLSSPSSPSKSSGDFFSFLDSPSKPLSSSSSSSSPGSGSIFGGLSSSSGSSSSGASSESLSRLSTQLSNLDNKLYKLEQRIELIERKVGVGDAGNSDFF